MAVEAFSLRKRELFADGQVFGTHGAYERIEGELRFAVDPTHAANLRIVDLDKAPREAMGGAAAGKVVFTARLSVLRPQNPSAGNRRLLLDVPNRGRRLSLTSFNRVPRELALTNPLHPGDGFLMAQGYTIATVGWQWDVGHDAGFWCDVPYALDNGQPMRGDVVCQLRPDSSARSMHIGQLGAAPYVPCDTEQADARLYRVDERTRDLQLLPRAAWRFAREDFRQRAPAGPAPVVADGSYVWMGDGFVAGALYLLVFRAQGAPVVGCGLLAVRDAAHWLRNGPFGRHDHVLGYGVSQTGRFLRQFIYEGLNQAEDGSQVFDGLWLHIAGAQRGDFNHRFAQPSAAGAPSFGQLFPFALQATPDALAPDAVAGAPAVGLADRCRAAGVMPKVMITNTSWEYWRGDAALAHIGADGSDLADDRDVRIYAFAGTQHIGAAFPLTRSNEVVRARYPFSVVEFAPLLRAALSNFAAWLADGTPPPDSRHPLCADGSAVARADVLAVFAAWPDWVLVDPDKLTRLRRLALAPEAGHANYPIAEAAAYPALVSAVNADGNEIAGVLLPDVTVPVGTHTGWNPRHPEDGGPDIAAIFVGFTRLFARDDAARAATADPRPPMSARYANRDDYAQRVRAAAMMLVAERYLRAADVDWVVDNCLQRFDRALEQD